MKHRDTENTEGPDDSLTAEIIGAAIEVHRQIGPGLLESAYLSCLCRELEIRRVGSFGFKQGDCGVESN